jgi:hypothetical protein
VLFVRHSLKDISFLDHDSNFVRLWFFKTNKKSVVRLTCQGGAQKHIKAI